MTTLTRQRIGVVGALVASFVLPAGTATAAAPVPTISDIHVSCAVDASDTPYYAVTVTFTHRGPTEVRVYGLQDGQHLDSDHMWFRGSGTDTFHGAVYAPTPAVETHLLKQGPQHALVDVVTPVVTTVACTG